MMKWGKISDITIPFQIRIIGYHIQEFQKIVGPLTVFDMRESNFRILAGLG